MGTNWDTGTEQVLTGMTQTLGLGYNQIGMYAVVDAPAAGSGNGYTGIVGQIAMRQGGVVGDRLRGHKVIFMRIII